MKLFRKFIAILMVLMILLATILPTVSTALNANVAVADDKETEKLLGTTSKKAKEENILGIASKYSVFVQDDFIIKAAETGGKVAVGGKLDASGIKVADEFYKYQIGCGEYNYKNTTHNGTADIVVGEGPIYNVDVLQGATIQGSKYNMEKKVVVSKDTTSMNWDDYSEEELGNFVQSNVIDFDGEFEYLKNLSKELAGKAATGTIIKDSSKKMITNYDSESATHYTNVAIEVTIFKGESKFLNIFNITNEEWANLKDIVFDVPHNSYIIINITGDNVILNSAMERPVLNMFREKNIFYPISRKEMAENGINEIELGYMVNEEQFINSYGYTSTKWNSIKDDDGYVKTYTKILTESENEWEKGQYFLYNLPDATSFEIKGNWAGTILAPNAKGTDSGKQTTFRNASTWCGGHLAGNLICKSYEGYQEFGNTVFSMPKSYLDLKDVNINKINNKTNETISGATMQIKYLDGTVLYQWESTDTAKTIKLAEGEYVLNEISSPKGYNMGEPIAFKVDENGKVLPTQIKYTDVQSVACDGRVGRRNRS